MASTTPSHDEWIPREDMATLARCSIDTIRRDERSIRAGYEATGRTYEPRVDSAGRVLVNVADFLQIGRIRAEDLTRGTTPAESAELMRARDLIGDLRTQVAELTGRLDLTEVTVATLRDQLNVKDRQIAKQADQITALIGRIGGAA